MSFMYLLPVNESQSRIVGRFVCYSTMAENGDIFLRRKEPILDFINRQKVSYYKRLLELPDNRLCKSVFNDMVRKGNSFWNYKEHVSSLLNQPDVNIGINIKEFNRLYGSPARYKLLMEVSSKIALISINSVLLALGKQNYLNNHNDLYASRLKLLSRTKISVQDAPKCTQ